MEGELKMKAGHAVIGANYGDEGKGLMTDYLASRSGGDALIVRFNGGAQAGHTVVAPDGRRHVFSHFGAGTFIGCPSHLSQFFIVNPILFAKEREQLHEIGITPIVSVDYRAFVTTPIDMFINQQIENRRGKSRYGSCGVGINETVTRSSRAPQFQLRVGDLTKPAVLDKKLKYLFQEWLPERLSAYQFDLKAPAIRKFIQSREALVERFMHDAQAMLDFAEVCFEFPRHDYLIFEGAQGLMLDEHRIDQWPHVTRSNTGLTNVVYLASRCGLERLDVTYVTRTYLTRHGAGPLEGECDLTFRDDTNVPNQFQGILRFAPLNWAEVNNSIRMDLAQAKRVFPRISADVAVTCVDQLSLDCDAEPMLPIAYLSYGATRNSVVEMARSKALSVA